MVAVVPPLPSATKVEPAEDDANQQPTLSHRLSIADGDDDADFDYMNVRFRASTPPFDAPHSGGPKKLAVVGSLPQLGDWHLDGSVPLRVVRTEGEKARERSRRFFLFSSTFSASLFSPLLTFGRLSLSLLLSLADEHLL